VRAPVAIGPQRASTVTILAQWLIKATQSGPPEFRSFARGVTVDLSAVKGRSLISGVKGRWKDKCIG
jgi:hypothetical protein